MTSGSYTKIALPAKGIEGIAGLGIAIGIGIENPIAIPIPMDLGDAKF